MRIGLSRTGRLVAAAASLLLAASAERGQASLATKSVEFDPPLIRAGEPVVARLLLGPGIEGLEAFSLGPSAGLGGGAASQALEVDRLSLARSAKGWVYSVSFVAWAPGPASVPAMNVGGRTFPSFDFLVVSTAGSADSSPGPRRPQVDPPGAYLYLYAAIGLLLLLGLAASATIFWLLPGARALLAAREARMAFSAFSRTLAWLEANIEAEGREWHALLARSLRVFLARRIIPEAEALTPAEFRSLPSAALPPGTFLDDLASLFDKADEVRFGGRESAVADRLASTRRAREAAASAESFATPVGS